MNVGHSTNKKAVLEELLDLGMVLVAIDARVAGVDVPQHLGVDPQLRLNLSYRFGRPMQVDAWGITADLTFGGVPHACRFPWDAIFLMVSHVNGEPYLFPDQVPHELLNQASGEFAAAGPARGRPKLSLVRANEAPPTEVPKPEAKTKPAAPRQQADDEADQPPTAKTPATPAEDARHASPPPTPRRRGHLRLIK